MNDIEQIAANMARQDNLATHHPLFLVQEKVRIWGMDSDYSDEYVWADANNEGIEADETQSLALEDGRPVGGSASHWEKIYYEDVWRFVTACFTAKACKDYIESNRHRLNSPRIYAASLYRNREMIAVREMLLAIAKEEQGATP